MSQENTGLAVASDNAPVSVMGQNDLSRAQDLGLALPRTREEMAMVSELLEAEAAIESIGLPMLKSSEIVGIPLTILDATFKTLVEKDEEKVCVAFTMRNENTQELFTCLKGSNAFNDLYVTFFTKWRAVAPREVPNMEFVTDSRWSKAGNDSVVLRKIQKTIGAGKTK